MAFAFRLSDALRAAEAALAQLTANIITRPVAKDSGSASGMGFPFHQADIARPGLLVRLKEFV
jgi:hypothetical protein